MEEQGKGRGGAQAELRERIRNRLSEGHLDVSAMPQTVGKVLRLLDAPDASIAGIAQAVGRDQAIAAHILGLANSAFYRGAVPASTLEQAIVRLGLRELKGAVLMMSLKGLFKDSRHPALARALWRHSLATAFVARRLAQLLGGSADETFVAGLIHDVGKMVLLTLYSGFEAADETAKISDAALSEILSEFHVEAGRLLAADWDLPAVAAEAVITHHANLTGIHSREGRCVALANLLVHDMGFPSMGSGPGPDAVGEACRQMNVDEAMKKALAEEMPGMLEELEISAL